MSVTKGSSLNEKMDEEAVQAVDETAAVAEADTQDEDGVNGVATEVDAKLNLDDDAPPTTDMDDFSTDTTSEASVLTVETKDTEPIDNEEIEKLEMAKRRVSLSLPIDENDKFIVTLSSPGGIAEVDTGVGASERTKKFLESDDAIISHIFSQTITSAGVTPTEDYDFSTGPLPDLITNEVLYATSSSEDVDTNEPDDLNDVDDAALMQSEMHAKQRPSIVIDCYDESSERPFPYYEEPVTPDEKDLEKSFDDQFGEEASNVIKTEVTEDTIVVTIVDNVEAAGGCYFDQTIECDDEDVDDGIEADDGAGNQPEAESKSSSESMDITKSGSINEESNEDDEDDGSQAESVVEHFENNETSSALTTEKVKTKKVVRKTTKTSTASTAYQTTTSTTSETTAAAVVSDSMSQVVEKTVKTNGVATTEMEVTTSKTNGSVETTTNGDHMEDDGGDSPKKSPTKLTKKKSDAGSKKKVKKSKKSDEKENISVFTEGSITKLLTEKFENITKNAENGKNYKNSRFKVIDFLSLQPSPYSPQPMASPTTVMMMMVSPETGQSQITNYGNGTTNGLLSPDLRNGRNSPYQDPDEMFDLDIVDHGSDNESGAEDDDEEALAKMNGEDSFSESASTDSLASSGKMWRHHNGYHDKLSPPVIIGKNFSKNLANSNNKFSTSTNDNFINYSNASYTKNGGQSDVKRSMKQFAKLNDVEKHDANDKDLANGLKPPTPPQPQWVKNNTVKYLRESYCNLVGLNETSATPYFKLQKPGPSDPQFRTLPLPSKQHNQHVRHSFTESNHSDEVTTPALATMTLARKPKALNGAVADEKKYKNGICVMQFDMKSSFSKFDALQKKNSVLLHGGNQTSPEGGEKKCRSCDKVVFQMEQVKAERNIWHRNCFRCQECNKQLNVDTYQSHESLLYCKPHFKALFAPKVVADSEEPTPRRKPEMIIRENQPVELPADVVRSSAKQDLGLAELQSLNVKSRFQHFENYQEEHEQNTTVDRSPSGVQRSASIMSKLARFHAKGMDVGISDDLLNGVTLEEDSAGSASDEGDDEGDEDIELIRARRAARKERPISLNNMNDIKSRFEGNSEIGREERREERKQEIQSIRSRLFMGKQAKIKEMYQQAVADSEQGIVAAGKKPDIDIGDKAKSLKEKFERGEIYNTEDGVQNGQTNGVRSKHSHQQEDSAVFEEGYSKKSRSIFLELDAAAAAQPSTLQRSSSSTTPRTPEIRKLNPALTQPENYIKSEDKIEDVVIETAAVSSKFKFFETYKPDEKEKRQFRITPPREGVVKLPSPDKEIFRDPDVVRSDSKANNSDDPSVAEKTHTASKVLSLFRQMEQQQNQPSANDGMKPMKRFTPPPDADRRRTFDDSEEEKNVTDSEEEEDESEEEEEETDEEDRPKAAYDDEFIKAAKSAARAKQLRDKFEKWEKTEIEREQNNSSINLCEPADQEYASQVESAKSLRAKFESLRDSGSQIQRDSSRVKVNRFVKEEDQP